MEKYIPCKWEAKESWSSNLISDKIDLKIKKIIRGRTLHNDQGINPRGRHCKYLCTNIGAPEYIRQTLTDIKEEIDSNTIIVGDFNTPLTPMDRSSKHKINKETQVLNDT